MGSTPTIAECDGDYNHDSRKNFLQWNLPVIDANNKQGSMEFSVPASIPGDFFPLQVNLNTFYKVILISLIINIILNLGNIYVQNSIC